MGNVDKGWMIFILLKISELFLSSDVFLYTKSFRAYAFETPSCSGFMNKGRNM